MGSMYEHRALGILFAVLLAQCGLVSGLQKVPVSSLGKRQESRPHVVFMIVDDLGWGDVGYHRDRDLDWVRTPNIDRLVQEGIELNRHYVHHTCTPSRAAFQSGRLPVHVTMDLIHHCDVRGAIPKNMTTIARVLRTAGYRTHHVGKWDVGMATPSHTPLGRGYETSVGYYSHANWMYSEREWLGSYEQLTDFPRDGFVDLELDAEPARSMNGTIYEEYIFKNRSVQIIEEHDPSEPLFLQYNSRLAHYPLQAPLEYQRRFQHVEYKNRRMYSAMVSVLDDVVQELVSALKRKRIWDNTLLILTSDNGGYVKSPNGPCSEPPAIAGEPDTGKGLVCWNGESGASNFPLKGGKYNVFEGGIRSVAFVSGGFLPPQARGTRYDGMIHIADWYQTLAGLSGQARVTDTLAMDSGMPRVDSLDIWPALVQGKVSPREQLGFLLDANVFLKGRYKYVRPGTQLKGNWNGGADYPTASVADDSIHDRGLTCGKRGCLFDVVSDPTEEVDLADERPQTSREFLQALEAQKPSIFTALLQADQEKPPGCKRAARELYGGFFGPFSEVTAPADLTASLLQGSGEPPGDAFDMIDEDANGKVSEEEALDFLDGFFAVKVLGAGIAELSSREKLRLVQQTFRSLDVDSDGGIDREEEASGQGLLKELVRKLKADER